MYQSTRNQATIADKQTKQVYTIFIEKFIKNHKKFIKTSDFCEKELKMIPAKLWIYCISHLHLDQLLK